MTTDGIIPQSSALAEAKPASFNEMTLWDPESKDFLANLPQLVKAIREQAERVQKAQAAGKSAKSPKANAVPLTVETTEDAKELGF